MANPTQDLSSLPIQLCGFDGCGRPVNSHGLCPSHARQLRTGRPLHPIRNYPRSRPGPKPGSEEWFFHRVTPSEGGCWVWAGRMATTGYGVFRIPGSISILAHRWSYEFLRADIPEGLVIDHLCRNRACVNPWHLEPVTLLVNWERGETPSLANARKTHCIHGHAFTPENTRLRTEGGRHCRTCIQERSVQNAKPRRTAP